MQGCTTYIQPSQGCVHLAKDDHKVVCTLQMLMQGCHKLAATLQGCNKLAARLPQPRNFHMGNDIYGTELGAILILGIDLYGEKLYFSME